MDRDAWNTNAEMDFRKLRAAKGCAKLRYTNAIQQLIWYHRIGIGAISRRRANPAVNRRAEMVRKSLYGFVGDHHCRNKEVMLMIEQAHSTQAE
mmetsp:Transcript_27636/g.51526  ORF Transcript_27636/g.51526 Transcript_27636/m.51526 type:complete len:94 (+) Transcript_27636:276-557(+)